MRTIIIITLCLAGTIFLFDRVHAEYSLNKHIFNAGGDEVEDDNYSVLSSMAEPLVGETFDSNYNCRLGFVGYYYFSTTTTPEPTVMPTWTLTSTPTIQQTGTPTPTVTVTPLDGFGNKLIVPKYIYFAPNPARGKNFKFVVHVEKAVEIEALLYTTSNQFVLKFNLACSGPGQYSHREYVGNLANGVYLLLVKAKDNSGNRTRLVKKLALIK